MIDAIKNYEFNSLLALFTYWVPLAVCAIVYLFRGIDAYRDDLARSKSDYYNPHLTVGVIVWYLIVSVTPVFNLFGMVFDCAASVFRWLGRVLDIPLVKKKAN